MVHLRICNMATTYCTWLNANDSPSTGSIVCYEGEKQYQDGPYNHMFVEISDCHVRARLHKAHYDSKEDFIAKLKLLSRDINLFIKHLEETEI